MANAAQQRTARNAAEKGQGPSVKDIKPAPKAPAKAKAPAAPTPAPAPVAPTQAKVPYAVLRPCNPVKGTLANAKVTTAGAKPYKVAADHTQAWWQAATNAIAKAKGPVAMADLVAVGAPGHFLTYAVRRGWLVVA